MLRTALSFIFIVSGMFAGGCGQQPSASPAAAHTRSQLIAPASMINYAPTSPINQLQSLIKNNPSNVSAINHLAYVYLRKVRQTVDFRFNQSAQELLKKALAVDPQNYDSWLYSSIAYMNLHEFEKAREAALKAQSINRERAGAYAILGDSCYELGRYDEAADAYDKMGELQPGSPYYARAAAYRALTGDPRSAIEIMSQAFEASDPADQEDHAWYLTQCGNLSFETGKIQQSEEFFRESLKIYPVSYNALAGLAKVSFANGKTDDAITLYKKAIAIVPMPDFIAALGDIYLLCGRKSEAERQYSLVEYIGLIGKINQEIYNRQLAVFYADHDRKLQDALRLAENEIQVRKDVYGYDALAWCLYKNGKMSEASRIIRAAMRLGTRDARMFYHAGMIYKKSDTALAKKYLRAALDTNPYFHPLLSISAKETLRKLR